MGIGNFFGRMPEDMQAHSQLYGVEIDSLSGRIAQALYPDADIAIQGFEQNRFQNGSFDVAVGNVPFGELGFRDTVHDTTKLHDFFFAEARAVKIACAIKKATPSTEKTIPMFL